MDIVILVATNEEFELARKYLSGFHIVKTGVGAGNVIKQLSATNEKVLLINVGFCGSNTLPIGTVTTVAKSYRLLDGKVEFEDYRNGYDLGGEYDCYTSNNFVTENTHERPVVYDMELNYIAAFPHKLLGAIKIVSDNLSVEQYDSSIDTSTEAQWKQVYELVYALIKSEHRNE